MIDKETFLEINTCLEIVNQIAYLNVEELFSILEFINKLKKSEDKK